MNGFLRLAAACIIIIFIPFSCSDPKRRSVADVVKDKGFDTLIDNRKIGIFTLSNSSGCTAQFTNFGARWISMWVPDRRGRMTDVVLGFRSVKEYINAGEPYHGAIVGRICGRIDDAKFFLDGKEYILAGNDLFGKPEKNHLHGGVRGFHRQVWEAREFSSEKGEQGVTFTYYSRDGEEGFPGNLTVEVSYLLSNENEIIIEYTGETDKPTPVNLTNHSYFNLNGEGNGNILGHLMMVNAAKYIECDSELIPTGRLVTVTGTPLDYLALSPMGKGINDDHDQIIKGKGYAAAMVLKENNGSSLIKAAEAVSEKSGIKLELFTDKPSVQLYNAWLFDGKDTGKSGKKYIFSGGFVMEAQGFPDAPNHKNFPSVILSPGEKYHHRDIYRFSLQKTKTN